MPEIPAGCAGTPSSNLGRRSPAAVRLLAATAKKKTPAGVPFSNTVHINLISELSASARAKNISVQKNICQERWRREKRKNCEFRLDFKQKLATQPAADANFRGQPYRELSGVPISTDECSFPLASLVSRATFAVK